MKLQQVSGVIDTLQFQVRQADMEINGLKDQLRLKDQELGALQEKFDKLKIAKALSGDTEQKRDAKLVIQKMLREVDKCIALLNR
ncbi:MAG: hypothetical protein PHS48_09080 [Bacteroidales bacterium]|nr:hypothetical protein [Bacteroidales bacterium]